MAAESKLEKYLADQIALLGGVCEKHVCPGTRGAPDRLVMWPVGLGMHTEWHTLSRGAHVPGEDDVWDWVIGSAPLAEFIETKAPNGKLSVLQQRDHERRRAMGFHVHVIWNMEQAEEYLRMRGKK